MHHDSRAYLEMRYDGESMDVVAVAFRDRGILPVEVQTREFSMESPVLTDDVWQEVRHGILKAFDGLMEQ